MGRPGRFRDGARFKSYAGQLRPQVEAVLPLEQAREALARVAGGHTRGKIVLQIGS